MRAGADCSEHLDIGKGVFVLIRLQMENIFAWASRKNGFDVKSYRHPLPGNARVYANLPLFNPFLNKGNLDTYNQRIINNSASREELHYKDF